MSSFTFKAPDCCSICLEEIYMTPSIMCMTCRKACHTPCLKEYLYEADRCPMCRTDYSDDLFIELFGTFKHDTSIYHVSNLHYNLSKTHVWFNYNGSEINTTVENFNNVWNKWNPIKNTQNRVIVKGKRKIKSNP